MDRKKVVKLLGMWVIMTVVILAGCAGALILLDKW